MPEIGAYEAKTHLPQLLEKVRKGETFVITKHGRPVAELRPIGKPTRERRREILAHMKSFQKTHSLEGATIRELIEEGREY